MYINKNKLKSNNLEQITLNSNKNIKKKIFKGAVIFSLCAIASGCNLDAIVGFPQDNEPTQETPQEEQTTQVISDINFNYCISNENSTTNLILYATQTNYPNGFETIRLNHSNEIYARAIVPRAFSTNYYEDTINSETYFFAKFNENVIDIENGVYDFEATINSNQQLDSLLVIEENNDLRNNYNYTQNQNNLNININDFGRVSIYQDNGTDPFIAANINQETINILDYSKFVNEDEQGLYFNTQIFNENETYYSNGLTRFNLESRIQDESPTFNYTAGEITPQVQIGEQNTDLLTLAMAAKKTVYGAFIENNQAIINYQLNPAGNGIIPESDIFVDGADGYVVFIAHKDQYSIDGTDQFTINEINDAQELNNPNIESLKRYNF